jgi:hypothetical protein
MDLDDPTVFRSLEPGRLFSLAGTGAAVRAIARSASADRPTLDPDGVGTCAVLVSDLIHPAYADVLAELLIDLGAPTARSLVSLDPAATFPRAADVVVIAGVSGSEPALLGALHVAAARGASVIVSAPESSPLAVVATERRADLVTYGELGDDADRAWWAAYAASVIAWRGVEAAARLADALDEVAGRIGPVVPSYANTAKQLAVIDEPLLLLATDRETGLLGRALEGELGGSSERPVRCIDTRRGLGELLAIAAYGERAAGVRDLFFDPELDGADDRAPSWQLVLLPMVSGSALAEDAARAAEALGAVLALTFERAAGEWVAAGFALLGQMSGAYRALYRQRQE